MPTDLIGILGFGVDGVVGVLIKALAVILVLGALILVRQVSLMTRVVSVPVNGSFRFLAWGYLMMTVVLTAIVMLV